MPQGLVLVRQRQAALLLLGARQDAGVTWKELARIERMHHGSASRVLSDLHRGGEAARLDEKRDGCSVYVLHAHIRDRETLEHHVHPKPSPEDAAVMAARVLAVIAHWGLDDGSPAMRGIAGELRRAVNRPLPTDQPTLGEPHG